MPNGKEKVEFDFSDIIEEKAVDQGFDFSDIVEEPLKKKVGTEEFVGDGPSISPEIDFTQLDQQAPIESTGIVSRAFPTLEDIVEPKDTTPEVFEEVVEEETVKREEEKKLEKERVVAKGKETKKQEAKAGTFITGAAWEKADPEARRHNLLFSTEADRQAKIDEMVEGGIPEDIAYTAVSNSDSEALQRISSTQMEADLNKAKETLRAEGIEGEPSPDKIREALKNQYMEFGITQLTPDQRQVAELTETISELSAKPNKTVSELTQLATLREQANEMKSSPTELYDPATGELVSREEASDEALENEDIVVKESENLYNNFKDQLTDIYNKRYNRFKAIEDKFNTTESYTREDGSTIQTTPSAMSAALFEPFDPSQQTLKARRLKEIYNTAKRDFDAVNRALLLNEDPAGVEKGFFAAVGESLAEAVGVDVRTERDFIEGYVDALREEGAEITPEQEEKSKRTFKEKIGDAVGTSIPAMVELLVTTAATEGIGALPAIAKYGKIIETALIGRYGQRGKVMYNIFSQGVKGYTSGALTPTEDITGAMMTGEGIAQGVMDTFNPESWLKGKSKVLGRLLEFGTRVTAGTITETAQEFTGDYLDNLEKSGLDYDKAFTDTFGGTAEEFWEKAAIIGTTSMLFSGTFNAKTLVWARDQVEQHAPDSDPRKKEILDAMDQELEVIEETKTKEDAEEIRKEVEITGEEERVEGKEGERLRVREFEKDRLEAEKPKEVTLPTFSKEIETKLEKHSEHHSEAHIEGMRTAMDEGKTFEEAHESALVSEKQLTEVKPKPKEDAIRKEKVGREEGLKKGPDEEVGEEVLADEEVERKEEVLEKEPEGVEKAPSDPFDKGQSVRIGKSPQRWEIVEEQPRQEEDLAEERFFTVRNEKTGEEQVLELTDLTPIAAKKEAVKAVKQPWELTKEQFIQSRAKKGEAIDVTKELSEKIHLEEVQKAIDAGETIPEKVLKQYPDLKPSIEAVPEVEITPEQRKERGKVKVSEAANTIADILGARKRIIGDESPLKDTTLFKEIVKLADGLIDMGVANAENIIQKLKARLKELNVDIDDKHIDEAEKEIKAQVVKKAKEPTKKKRGFAKRLPKTEGVSEEIREGLTEKGKYYIPKTNKSTKAEVKLMIEVKGVDQSKSDVINTKNDMSPSNRVALGFETIKEFDRMAKDAKTEAEADSLYDQANEVSNFLSEYGTEMGQGTQAFAIWGVSSPEAVTRFVRKQLKGLDVELTESQEKELKGLERKFRKAPAGFKKQNVAEDMMRFVLKQKGIDWMEVGQSIWYANVLSGHSTQTVNFVANMANVIGEITSAAFYNPKSLPSMLRGLYNGFGFGFLNAANTFKTGYSPVKSYKTDVGKTSPLETFRFKGGVWNPFNYHKYVARMMNATDVWFFSGLKEMRAWEMAHHEAQEAYKVDPSIKVSEYVREKLYNTKDRVSEAKKQATEEGLKGSEYKRRVWEIMEQSRPEEMMDDAYNFAAEGTFNHEVKGRLGMVTDMIAKLADKMTIGLGKAGEFKPIKHIVPFTRVISNVANSYLNWTPYGGVRAAKGYMGKKGTQFEREYTKEERVKLAIKAAVGTAGMAAVYAMTDDEDGIMQITASGTGDYRKNFNLKATGWQPYSIKIGDTWISYANSPLAPAFTIIGNVRDYEKYRETTLEDKDFMTKTGMVMGSSMKYMTDMTFLKGLSEFMKVFESDNPKQGMSQLMKTFENTAKGYVVPNFYTQIAREYQAFYDIPLKKADGLYQQVVRDVPGARDSMNNMVNALGEDILPDTDRYISQQEYSKEWDFIARNKAWVATPFRSTSVYDPDTEKERDMTDDEFYKFTKKRGALIKEEMQRLIEYENEYTPAEIRDEMRAIKTDATAQAKESLFF